MQVDQRLWLVKGYPWGLRLHRLCEAFLSIFLLALDETNLMGMHSQLGLDRRCNLQVSMLQGLDCDLVKHDRRFFIEQIHLLLHRRVHSQRPNLTKHRHTLIFLNITGWDSVNKHLRPNILDTWLEAWSCHALNLNELLALLI